MGIPETLLLYLVIGCAVAAANALLAGQARWHDRLFGFVAAALFWPILAPFILTKRRALPPLPGDGSLEARISAAEARLLSSLGSLDGVAEDILTPEVERVRGLGEALRRMARRAAEMDALLATPELSRDRALAALAQLKAGDGDPRNRTVRARLANIERLEAMRTETLEALEQALLEVEEIGSHTALLKFADRPGEEVVRMIRGIADSVEAVAEGLALRD